MPENVQILEENSEQLTPKQEKLVTLLLAGVSASAAAKQLDINDKTVYRWLKLAHVQHAYRQAQRDTFETSLNELRTGVSLAISTLREVLTDPNVKAYTKVQAASIWLDHAVKLYTLSEVEQRVAELEQYVKDRHR